MLNSKEKYIMEYVYQKCQDKKSCLISPREIISFAADKYVLTNPELEKIMTNLSYDNYIELARADKQGKEVFWVSLKLKGEAFHRELSNNKRTWMFNILRTVGLAALGAAVGFIVRMILN